MKATRKSPSFTENRTWQLYQEDALPTIIAYPWLRFLSYTRWRERDELLGTTVLSRLFSTHLGIALFIMLSFLAFILLCVQAGSILSAPTKAPVYAKYFDVQGHRGGRGEAIENTLPAFAWGLIDGVTTLELDNGISKDGHVIVWHDEQISATKCNDTKPAFKNDLDFPYVGKYIANLTLAQIKTLDCGSKRLNDFPLQLTYPGTKLSTLNELFDFASCADPKHDLLWNIESKINPVQPNITRSVDDFVENQHAAFLASGYPRSQITYQSFDWRSIIRMKAKDPQIPTSALISYDNIYNADNSTNRAWFAGINIDDFPGATLGERIAEAAKTTGADVLSPSAVSLTSKSVDPALDGYVPFTTKEMISRAHELGMTVRPWTVDRHNIAEQLLEWKADGIISDYPHLVRNLVQQKGFRVAPKISKSKVLECLNKHLKKQ
ncbi:PLC-like phosphodiesterase [Crucibulum laeve]|uniref:PLC-like phosphodiesterase n=1 Tax=Crucibulum laeve TaxID=68775 RepID=A0A5C3MBU2_9AGAR|nr:PLC-like phosphodiesterase [Crucibulum laeve]